MKSIGFLLVIWALFLIYIRWLKYEMNPKRKTKYAQKLRRYRRKKFYYLCNKHAKETLRLGQLAVILQTECIMCRGNK